jgi:hypothetical protein
MGDAMDRDGISEAASENRGKSKRGRPGALLISSADPSTLYRRMVDADGRKPEGFLFSHAKTLRGVQNSEYAFWAGLKLREFQEEYPELAELIGPPGDDVVAQAAVETKHLGVLSELGRVLKTFKNGEEACLEWALLWLKANPRPTTKRFIRLVRQARLRDLGRPVTEAVGDLRGLRNAFIDAIHDYAEKNPATERWKVLEALNDVYSRLYDWAGRGGTVLDREDDPRPPIRPALSPARPRPMDRPPSPATPHGAHRPLLGDAST